jgi:hypothetical protein
VNIRVISIKPLEEGRRKKWRVPQIASTRELGKEPCREVLESWIHNTTQEGECTGGVGG